MGTTILAALWVGVAIWVFRAIGTGNRSGLSFALAACVALAVPTAIVVEGEYRERQYLAIAEEATGRDDLTLKCQGVTGAMIDADNYAGTASGHNGNWTNINLDWKICSDLRSYAIAAQRSEKSEQPLLYASGISDTSPTFPGFGVHVLTHEFVHSYGIQNEAATECYALQNNAFTSMSLGASRREGEAFAEAYWSFYYPRMPAGYFSTDCVDGGIYDLNPDDTAWPTADSQSAFKMPALSNDG